jgi:hypothetical protein
MLESYYAAAPRAIESMNASTSCRRKRTALPILMLGMVGWRKPELCWRTHAVLICIIFATSSTVIIVWSSVCIVIASYASSVGRSRISNHRLRRGTRLLLLTAQTGHHVSDVLEVRTLGVHPADHLLSGMRCGLLIAVLLPVVVLQNW